jgi:hypothetical protein
MGLHPTSLHFFAVTWGEKGVNLMNQAGMISIFIEKYPSDYSQELQIALTGS